MSEITIDKKQRYVGLAPDSKRPDSSFKKSRGYKYEDVEHYDDLALIVPPEVVVFDFDDAEMAMKALDVFESRKLKPRIVKTTRGIHAYFKTKTTLGRHVKATLLCGLVCDVLNLPPDKVGYVKVKQGGEWRQVLIDTPLNKLPEMPEWLSVPKQIPSIVTPISEGERNDGMFRRCYALQHQMYSKDAIIEGLRIYNEYIMSEPLDEAELAVILRDESFIPDAEKGNAPWFEIEVGPRGKITVKFLHDVLARYLVEHFKLVVGENEQLYTYQDGYYQPLNSQTELKKMVVDHYPAITQSGFSNVKLGVIGMAAKRADELDKEVSPYVLNVKNGRLNLKTGELTPHSEDFFDLQQVPTKFIKGAKDEVLDTMISNVFLGNQGLINLFDEMVGYCLLKHLYYRKAFFLVGDGANGKSTLINLIRQTIGEENCCAVSPHDFEKRFATVTLHRKLVNLADDIGNSRIDQTGNYKKACSGDALQVEEKGQPMYVIRPYATPIFAANSLPHFSDESEGANSRRLIIPFKASFRPGSEGYDPTIALKLNRPEVREALLYRAFLGLQRVMANDGFVIPPEVEEAGKEFVRENSYTLQWIDMECITEEDIIGKTPTELHGEYRRWCQGQGARGESIVGFGKKILKEFPTLETWLFKEGGKVMRKYRNKEE